MKNLFVLGAVILLAACTPPAGEVTEPVPGPTVTAAAGQPPTVDPQALASTEPPAFTVLDANGVSASGVPSSSCWPDPSGSVLCLNVMPPEFTAADRIDVGGELRFTIDEPLPDTVTVDLWTESPGAAAALAVTPPFDPDTGTYVWQPDVPDGTYMLAIRGRWGNAYNAGTLFYVTISAAADVPRPQITVQSATGLPVLGRPVGTCWQPEGADEPDCLEEQPVFLTDDVFHVGEAVDVRTLWPTPPDRVDMTLYISIDYAAVVDSITDVPAADGLTFRWAPEANPGSYVLRVQAFWPQGEQSADYFVHVGPEPRTPPTIMIWALGGGFQPGIEGDSCWQGSCRELPIRSDMPPGTPVVTPFQLAANWPDGPAEVTMTVYDAADRERPLHRAAFAPPPSSSVLWAPPQNLPPGEYVLVTTFRWPEGEVTRGFPVRVIGSQLPR